MGIMDVGLPSSSGKVGRTRTTSLVGGAAAVAGLNTSVNNSGNIATALSGICSAGVLKTAIQVNGAGRLNLFANYAVDATSRTVRVRVTVEGVIVYDRTSAAITVVGTGLMAVGAPISAGGVVFQPIDFYTSLLIEIASSLSETDKTTVAYNYETRQ